MADGATNELADEVTETVRDLDVPVADDLLDDGVVDDLLGGNAAEGTPDGLLGPG